MAHGNIYPPERVDAALANYFRPGNLAALRELALLWVADRVDEGLQSYMEAHAIPGVWETRERVLVAVTGAPGGDHVVRRASRMASRLRSELIGVHVVRSDGLVGGGGSELAAQRTLIVELGGTYREVVGDDVATALVEFARGEKATQVVLGASRQSRWKRLTGGSIVDKVARASAGFDVHVIASHPEHADRAAFAPVGRLRKVAPLPVRRQVGALVAGGIALILLTLILIPLRDQLTLPTDFLLFLVLTIAVAAAGGIFAGVLMAVAASLVLNWFFVPPLHTFTIGDGENVVAISVFVAVAATVSLLVDRAARRTREALQARAEAQVLANATAVLVGEQNPLPDLVDQLRATFSLDGVSVLSNRDDGWVLDASSGDDPPTEPFEGDRWDLTGDGTSVLVLRGPELATEDQQVLRAYLSQLALALQRRRLQAAAAEAAHLADANALRVALLQAVSHDLRTPLATIKASATSLLQPDVNWDAEQRREFLASIDAEADRLNRVVGNLLDMSRLQAGSVQITSRPVYLEDVVAASLASLSPPPGDVVIEVPETVPAVQVDPALLERAVANVVANAVSWAPEGSVVRVEAGEVGQRVHLRVIDRGPGVAAQDRRRVMEPFQRLGDRSTQAGVGLGLAVARGFVQAMGGELTLDDTPGGGLTVVFDLPEAA
jgi:two-component system sensor histidine kinase KdpD